MGHLRSALSVASGVGDPALLLRVTAPFLSAGIEDDEAITAEAAASDRIRAGLPTDLRPAFETYRGRLVAG